jgi:hypothetical protein
MKFHNPVTPNDWAKETYWPNANMDTVISKYRYLIEENSDVYSIIGTKTFTSNNTDVKNKIETYLDVINITNNIDIFKKYLDLSNLKEITERYLDLIDNKLLPYFQANNPTTLIGTIDFQEYTQYNDITDLNKIYMTCDSSLDENKKYININNSFDSFFDKYTKPDAKGKEYSFFD